MSGAIRDPNSHEGMKVSASGRAQIDSVGVTEDRHFNEVHQRVWSLPFENIDPVGANDYFFYFKNTLNVEYLITDIRISSTVVGHIDVDHVTGLAVYVGETAVATVNRYLGSPNQVTAEINTDTDITGLTDEGNLFRIDLDAVGKLGHLRTTAGIIIPQGQAFALKWSEATGILSGVVSVSEIVPS